MKDFIPQVVNPFINLPKFETQFLLSESLQIRYRREMVQTYVCSA